MYQSNAEAKNCMYQKVRAPHNRLTAALSRHNPPTFPLSPYARTRMLKFSISPNPGLYYPRTGPVRDLLFADTSTSPYTTSGSGARGAAAGPDASRGGPTAFVCVGQVRRGTAVRHVC